MFGFLCKRLVPILRYSSIKSYSSGSSSTNKSFLATKDAQESFTVSYLMKSCGLSLKNALTASKKVQFDTPDKPDSVLRLLEDHGFTNTQITKTIRIRPEFLLADPKKTLSPKLEFFHSIGLSTSVLSRLVSSHPSLLAYSLDNHIIPSCKFIKSIVNVDDKVAMAVRHCPKILLENVQKSIAPNISVLRDHGVPASHISLLLTRHGSSLLQNCDKFKKCVKQVIEMGSKPSRLAFVLAVQVTVVMTESTWNRKVEVYRHWGWSETEFRAAFKTQPILMNLSEKKITSAMEFLVNNMGMESAVIARNPSVLGLSLEKRIIPRCLVIKVLLLKGLKNRDLGLATYLFPIEKVFLDKFVSKYEEDVPELLSVFQGKRK